MVLFALAQRARRPAEVTSSRPRLMRTRPGKSGWSSSRSTRRQAMATLERSPIGRSAQATLSRPGCDPRQPTSRSSPPAAWTTDRPSGRENALPGAAYSRAAFQQVVRPRVAARFRIRRSRTIANEELTAENRTEFAVWNEAHAWSPNALRHAYGTRLRESGGIEAAQMALGHAKPDTSLIYTDAAKRRAIEAVRGTWGEQSMATADSNSRTATEKSSTCSERSSWRVRGD